MSSGVADPGLEPFDRPGPTLAETGESLLLQRLLALTPRAPRLVVRPGDDAAVLRPDPGLDQVISQDCTVEGVDFVRRWSTPRRVGRRALTTALSDLAAMGAGPVWCMATLCAPPGTMLEDVLEIQRGICEVAVETGCSVAGGDVSTIDGPIVIDVSVGGEVAPGAALRRDAARPGDLLLVTGRLGRAAAGLELLRAGEHGAGTDREGSAWLAAHLEGTLRLAEGAALVAAGVRCAGDVSDGLLVDASRTAEACAAGAELWVESLPVDPGLRERFPDRWRELALAWGDDFELLAAAPPAVAESLLAGWAPPLAPLTVVGRLTDGSGLTLLEREGGSQVDPPEPRSRHFR